MTDAWLTRMLAWEGPEDLQEHGSPGVQAVGLDGLGALPLVLRLAVDADSDVRGKAATMLPELIPAGTTRDDGPAAAALLALPGDEEPATRDWAAFGLGTLSEVDSPAVHDALVGLLGETEEATAGEAAVGLARRRDPRVLPELRRRLALPDGGNLWIEAASAMADPSLLLLLESLAEPGLTDPLSFVLVEAIAACAQDGLSSD